MLNWKAELVLGSVVGAQVNMASAAGESPGAGERRDGGAAVPKFLAGGRIEGVQDCLRRFRGALGGCNFRISRAEFSTGERENNSVDDYR